MSCSGLRRAAGGAETFMGRQDSAAAGADAFRRRIHLSAAPCAGVGLQGNDAQTMRAGAAYARFRQGRQDTQHKNEQGHNAADKRPAQYVATLVIRDEAAQQAAHNHDYGEIHAPATEFAAKTLSQIAPLRKREQAGDAPAHPPQQKLTRGLAAGKLRAGRPLCGSCRANCANAVIHRAMC